MSMDTPTEEAPAVPQVESATCVCVDEDGATSFVIDGNCPPGLCCGTCNKPLESRSTSPGGS